MKYLSTRGGSAPQSFCDILLEGLAPDGGLYMPEHYPQVDAETLIRWSTLSYADLAFEVLSLFIDDIPAEDLRRMLRQTYTEEVFGHPDITPVRSLGAGLQLMALSNGPTLAFKDMAMQCLGRLFEYELGRRGQVLRILGATSGDTGSAAEYAMRGRENISVFMLSPAGRMSPFQQAQMYSLQDANIHNLAVDGVFDDCQDIVKAVGRDQAFKQTYAIGTVNSINWARVVAQLVYYFRAWLVAAEPGWQDRVRAGQPLPQVSVVVPSGNFGNVCAGHVARMMGLPLKHLVVATNENSVLDEFFRTGVYRVRSAAETLETSSPSMDISKASNFERFIFDLFKRDTEQVRRLFSEELSQKGYFSIDLHLQERCRAMGFLSGRSEHAKRLACIRELDAQGLGLIDPHTADGVVVARALMKEHPDLASSPVVILETALPAKFGQTIQEATGKEPPRPAHLKDLESLPRRVHHLPPQEEAVRQYIRDHVR